MSQIPSPSGTALGVFQSVRGGGTADVLMNGQFGHPVWSGNTTRWASPLRFDGWQSPLDGLLFALNTPAPREGDEKNVWGASLLKARQEGNSLPFLVFADFCYERGWDQWEAIARSEAARISGGV